MANVTYDADLDLVQNALINALMHPTATDPGSPTTGQVWFNSTSGRLKYRTATDTKTVAELSDVTGGAITGNLWDAQTVLVSVADNDPQPVTLSASQVIGRGAAGDAGAIDFADITSGFATEAYADQAETDAVATANAYTDSEITNLKNGVSTNFDTLVEIATFIQNEAGDLDALVTLVNTKATSYTQNFGDGAAQTFGIAHNLGTTDVIVAVFRNSDNRQVECQVVTTNANTVTIDTNSTPSTDAYRAVVIG